MSLLENINSLKEGLITLKDSFKQAFTNAGIDVPNNIKFKEYPEYISNIKTAISKDNCYIVLGQQSEINAPIINGLYYHVDNESIPSGILKFIGSNTDPVYTNGYGSFIFRGLINDYGYTYIIGYAYGNSASELRLFYIKEENIQTPGGPGWIAYEGSLWTGEIKVVEFNITGYSDIVDGDYYQINKLPESWYM